MVLPIRQSTHNALVRRLHLSGRRQAHPLRNRRSGSLARQGSAVALFHVPSSANRESIDRHGLDWTLTSAARGIAGSNSPQQEGCFLCQDQSEADWFACMGSTFGPVDVWAAEGVDESDLIESPEHY